MSSSPRTGSAVVRELQVDVEVGGLEKALHLLQVVARLRLHAQLVAWICDFTPLGPSSRMILPIFFAFSCEMPSFSVEVMRYSLPLCTGSPLSRLLSEMPRLMSLVWNTSSTAFARSSEFALMTIDSPLHAMEASVPLKS